MPGAPNATELFEDFMFNLVTAVARDRSAQDLGAIEVSRSVTDHPPDMLPRSAPHLRSSFYASRPQSIAVSRLTAPRLIAHIPPTLQQREFSSRWPILLEARR